MRILVLNSGSSSIKFKLYRFPQELEIIDGAIEKIGESSATMHINYNDEEIVEELGEIDHQRALEYINTTLLSKGIIDSMSDIDGVGHRVVHGGEHFRDAVIIDSSVKSKIKQNIPLAPLHNLANLKGIEVMESLLPDTPQIAVFDTAFHQTIEPSRYIYALPLELYQNKKIRRYGFHGTSHDYLSKRAAQMCGIDVDRFNVITLHLGNGASVCAIKNGKSYDTSMGMTPLEGLVMGTRSGDIDPAIIFYLMREGYSADSVEDILNKKSGLKGLCGYNDMREIERLISNGENSAKLAFEIFVNRVLKYIGAYALELGRVDAIVFSGGIGSNSPFVREEITKRLYPLGVEIDNNLNRDATKEDRFIQSKSSKIALLSISTDEELQIAKSAFKLIKKDR